MRRLVDKAPGLVAWLYKHDRTWLKQHSPLPTRACNLPHIDWEKRDAELVVLAQKAVPEVLAKAPPVRMTRHEVIKANPQIPVRWWAGPNMIKTSQYFKAATESVGAYQIRRLKWARTHVPIESKMKIQEFLALAQVTRFGHRHPMYSTALKFCMERKYILRN